MKLKHCDWAQAKHFMLLHQKHLKFLLGLKIEQINSHALLLPYRL